MTAATFNASLTLTMPGGVTSHLRLRVEKPSQVMPNAAHNVEQLATTGLSSATRSLDKRSRLSSRTGFGFCLLIALDVAYFDERDRDIRRGGSFAVLRGTQGRWSPGVISRQMTVE